MSRPDLDTLTAKFLAERERFDAGRDAMTHRENIERLIDWFTASANLLRACAEMTAKGEAALIPRDASLAFGSAGDLFREFAAGKVPLSIRDVVTAGNKRTAAEQSDVDYATAYLLACGEGGYGAPAGAIHIVDPRPNRTIEEWFGVSYDTARGWRKRSLTQQIDCADAEALKVRTKRAGADYIGKGGKSWQRGGGK